MWLPHRLALLAVAALTLAGCRRAVPSTQYQTPDIQGDFRVDSWGPEETTVWAFLKPAGEQEEAGLYLTMSEGDELWAEAGGRRLRLETDPEDQSWVYEGTLHDQVPDGVVRIGFERRDGASAPESTADLPAPFDLDPVPAEVSRASALEVRWTPVAGDPLEITVGGDCLQNSTVEVKDDRGWYTLPADTIKPIEGAAKDCDANLIVRRTRQGQPDPGLHDGSTVLASQARKVPFRSVP
jgi:hypothetical protein